MDAQTFEETYYYKRIRIAAAYFNQPSPITGDFEGVVTAALYNYEDGDVSILGVMADGYIMGKTPEKWINIHTKEADLDHLLSNITILD